MAPAPDFYGASPRIVHVDLRKLYAPLWKVRQTAQEVDKGDVSRSNAHPLHLKALGGGRYYVIDGNHRVLEALLRGEKTLPARVGYPGPVPGGVSDLARHADAVVASKAGRSSGRSAGKSRIVENPVGRIYWHITGKRDFRPSSKVRPRALGGLGVSSTPRLYGTSSVHYWSSVAGGAQGRPWAKGRKWAVELLITEGHPPIGEEYAESPEVVLDPRYVRVIRVIPVDQAVAEQTGWLTGADGASRWVGAGYRYAGSADAGRSSGTRGSITPAKTVAINLLVVDPAESFDSLRVRLRNSQSVYDQVSRTFVPSDEVLRALNDLEPRAYSPTARLITVYHATSNEAARELLLRGFLPETKPRPRGDYEYAPGRGIDAGLYVGATPEAVRGYGRVVLAVQVPLKLLSVPTEQRQLGVTSVREALAGHDGAVVHDRIPADAFKKV